MMNAAIAFNEGRRNRQDAVDFENELKKLRKGDPRRLDIAMLLTSRHPVMALPFDAFVASLRLAVESNLVVFGRHKTKTFIEMSRGLARLDGSDKTPFPESMPFDWEPSIELLGPMVAGLYIRMHAELQLLRPLPLPNLDTQT